MDDLSLTALDQMSDAAAHATIWLAQSTEVVNGQRGEGNFSVPPGHDHQPASMAGR